MHGFAGDALHRLAGDLAAEHTDHAGDHDRIQRACAAEVYGLVYALHPEGDAGENVGNRHAQNARDERGQNQNFNNARKYSSASFVEYNVIDTTNKRYAPMIPWNRKKHNARAAGFKK